MRKDVKNKAFVKSDNIRSEYTKELVVDIVHTPKVYMSMFIFYYVLLKVEVRVLSLSVFIRGPSNI